MMYHFFWAKLFKKVGRIVILRWLLFHTFQMLIFWLCFLVVLEKFPDVGSKLASRPQVCARQTGGLKCATQLPRGAGNIKNVQSKNQHDTPVASLLQELVHVHVLLTVFIG